MISSDPACRGIENVFVYVVPLIVALVTGVSSARCCCAFMACHCASVGAVGLFWPAQTLYGLLCVSSTRKWVTNTSFPASAVGRLLSVTVTMSVDPLVLSVL